MKEETIQLIKIKKSGTRYLGYGMAMLVSIPWCIAFCRVLYGLIEAQLSISSDSETNWLAILMLLSLLGPYFLSAWKSNLLVFLYREMALCPKQFILKGRYFFVPDLKYTMNYSTLLWYQRKQLLSQTTRYYFYGVRDGNPQKISSFIDFFNPERTAAISSYYKTILKRYKPQSSTQLFWLEYPQKPRFTWTLAQYLRTLFMLFLLPMAAAGIPVFIYSLITEWAQSNFSERFLLIGVGGLFSVIAFFFVQESLQERQFFRIRQILGIRSIVFVPDSLQINYWLRSKKVLHLQDLKAVSINEDKLIFHCKKGDQTLPAYPFEILQKRIENYYIRK